MMPDGHCGKCDKIADDLAVARAMQEHGGGFVQRLSLAWLAGDDENRAKIKATWPEYWQTYAERARRDAERQP